MLSFIHKHIVMVSDSLYEEIRKFKVEPGSDVRLKDYHTDYRGDTLSKQEGEDLLEDGRKDLSEMQDRLYAHNRHSILIILQAMDASGKDGAVKHILSGVNPLGVKIHSFKAPSSNELDHDYLWRHALAVPAKGEIAIHNRSHYENVLVTRVHPEYILKENIPGITSVDKITDKFWQSRLKQINRFEKNLAKNGTVVLKFFLYLSKKEQRTRLLSRIDDPSKNWKFELGDLKERGFWDEYHKAYEEAISATSTAYAPWYIVPADNKWFTRLAIAAIIYRELDTLKMDYPVISEAHRQELLLARERLMNGD
jgi:PPK2 family polyphosphate:nucleotide phosphotransferase